MNRDEIVRKAVDFIKTSPYKGTAIKVEFEANVGRDDDYYDDDDVNSVLLEKLEEIGLASGGSVRRPLTYSEFYNDGSVDSEWTFTLLLDNPENVFLLPKLVNVWNDLCRTIRYSGDDNDEWKPDVTGAGMHMAILTSTDGSYDTNGDDNPPTATQMRQFNNFTRSMVILLPALYFLATHNHISRSLHYRRPAIRANGAAHGHDKYNAITYKDSALEYRIFDTCYDNPQDILDNVVVIANTLKFWSTTYKDPNPPVKRVAFGNDGGYELERFYNQIDHIALLDCGLQHLKPGYKTIKQLKLERNFKLNRRTVGMAERRVIRDAEKSYTEYSERYDWSIERHKLAIRAYRMNYEESRVTPATIEQARSRVEEEVERRIADHTQAYPKQDLRSYLDQRLRDYRANLGGSYTLEAA